MNNGFVQCTKMGKSGERHFLMGDNSWICGRKKKVECICPVFLSSLKISTSTSSLKVTCMKIDFKASSTLRKTLPHMTGGTKESSVNETMQCTNNNNS